MRQLAIALGMSAAMLLAGGVAWKAEATSLRSGTLNLPSATREPFSHREDRLLRLGAVLPAWLSVGMRPV